MLKKLILLISLLFYFLFFIFYFNSPFVGPYGHSHLQYSIAARSYQEFGWQKFIPYVWPKQAYLNHPPLLYVFLTLFYKLFNVGDFSLNWYINRGRPSVNYEYFVTNFIGRLMPFLFSLGSALFFYLIIKKYFSKKTALYSLFFYLTFPMLLFYGAFLQFEPLVLFFSLGSLYFLDMFLYSTRHSEESLCDTGTTKNPMGSFAKRTGSFSFDMFSFRMTIFLLLSVIFLLLSVLSDFSGLIFAFLIIPYLVFKKRRRFAFFFFILTTLYLILYTRYLSSIGFPLSSLLSAYFSRAALTEIFSISFLFRFLSIILIRFFIYFSPLIFFLPGSPIPFRSRSGIFHHSRKLVTILFLFPVLNSLLLAGGTLTHPYFLFFFIPIIALLYGLLFERRSKATESRTNTNVTSRSPSFDFAQDKSATSKNKNILSLLLIVHLLWSQTIFSLKIYQIKKYSWQYEVTRETAKIIGKDKSFYKNWALDRELFYWYEKKLPIEIYPNKLMALNKFEANYYLFVCFPQCHQSDHLFLKNLSKKFSWEKIETKVPAYVFNLNQKPNKENLIELKDKITYGKQIKAIEELKKILKIEQL